MHIKLLTSSDIERIVRVPRMTWKQLDGDLGLCTIMEVLETGERARKGKGIMDTYTFLRGWRTLRAADGALDRGDLQIAVLDQNCLMDDLFEQDEAGLIVGLWPLADGKGISPDRTVRRLILRPSERKWWGEEPYVQMESWHSEVA